MKKLKNILRLILLSALILLAMSGVFFAISPRRPDQDHDNEIKTEIVEGKEANNEMNNRN